MSLENDKKHENATGSGPQWQKKTESVPQNASNTSDVLSSHQGQPLLGQRGTNAKYLGRVVVELWEDGRQLDDSYKISFLVDATDGNAEALLQRVAPALSKRVQKGPTFKTGQ